MRMLKQDTYINRIRQVVNLLGYQKPQILEVFKNNPHKIILGSLSHYGLKAGSRDS